MHFLKWGKMMNEQLTQVFGLGAVVGQGKALGATGERYLLAMAKLFLELRETSRFKAVAGNWDEFCTDYVGLSSRQINNYIHQLQEFGETYLSLSGLVPISTAFYQKIAHRIHDDKLEINGELVDIVPENANLIRTEIKRLRAELRQAAQSTQATPKPDLSTSLGVSALQDRADAILNDFRTAASHRDNALRVVGIISRYLRELSDIARNANPAA